MYREFATRMPEAGYFDKAQLPEHYFRLLWYAYNRGGFFTMHTARRILNRGKTSSWNVLKKLQKEGWIDHLYSNEAFPYVNRPVPSIYRISFQFLRYVGDSNSSIRKQNNIHRILRLIAIADYFSIHTEYQLVNRKDRKVFLTTKHGVPEEDLPAYWVNGKEKDKVISVNYELMVNTKGTSVVFSPSAFFRIESDFQGDFLPKWKKVLNANGGPKIGVFCLAETEQEHTYFQNWKKTLIAEKPQVNRDQDLLKRLMDRAKNSSVTTREERQVIDAEREIEHVFYPDTRQQFY